MATKMKSDTQLSFDDADRRILAALQRDSTLSVQALAEIAQMSPSPCWRRVRALREAGVIKAEGAVIDWRALGYAVEVSLRFTLDKTNPRAFDEFIQAARDVPEVTFIETFLGRVDVRLTVIARDMGHWTGIYRDRILTLPHIAEVEALMLVATIKETGGLPL